MPTRSHTDDVSSPYYRGGTICEIPDGISLSLGALKEYVLNPKNPVHFGILRALRKGNALPQKGNVQAYVHPIVGTCQIKTRSDGKFTAQYPLIRQFPLHKALNLPKENKFKWLDDLDLAKYLPKVGVGMLPVGRGNEEYGMDYIAPDEFAKKDYMAVIRKFIDEYLKQIPEESSAFFAVAAQTGLAKNIGELETKLRSIDDKFKVQMSETYTLYVLPRLLKSAPTLASMDSYHTKFLCLDCLADTVMRGFAKRKDGTWSNELVIYPLKRNEKIWLYVAAYATKAGLEEKLIGKKKAEMLPIMKEEVKMDATEKSLIGIRGNGDPAQFIEDESNGCLIKARRDTNSPYVHIPAIEVTSTMPQMTTLFVGERDVNDKESIENTILITKQ